MTINNVIRKQVIASFNVTDFKERAVCPFCGETTVGSYPHERGYMITEKSCDHFSWWVAGLRCAVVEFVGLIEELNQRREQYQNDR